MNCSLCKRREVTDHAARECERKGYRMICSFCIAETYRAQRPRAWPKLTLAPAITIELVEAEKEVKKAA